MKPSFRKVGKQDIEGAGEDLQSVASSLNDFADSVMRMMDGKIDAVENCGFEVKDLSVESGRIPFQFAPKKTPVAVIVSNCLSTSGEVPSAAVQIAWEIVNGNVNIKQVTGLTPGTAYNLKLVII